MQEIVVNTWCDRGAAHAARVPGQAVAVSVPGWAARELDLCEACRGDLLGELTALVADRSRPAGPGTASTSKAASKRAAPPVSAPALFPASPVGTDLATSPDADPELRTCPLDGWVARTYRALEQHAKVRHSDYRLPRLFGSTCPVCGVEPGVLGMHGVRAHGIGLLTGLFVLARSEGDPHGVVAAREAEWVELRRALGIGAAA